ncbi:MAG TPA: isocitrate lyase/PEP mutase family protein [Isosphaeraceae bacterium]|jgi:2-methylisocitrate lyase-like PEP mutase family enzyme|nr:isocitrate lyase/PEP mutase family protein [Isosphaeraceae bacterium]
MAKPQAKGKARPKERRATWREVLKAEQPVLLPAAFDALSARMIERAGFAAYQIGGFALSGAQFALPDVDLLHFGEINQAARGIIEASSLPVLIDCDDGYGDAKNVTRTVRGHEAIGASALFIEDQQAPKRCGHMGHKKVLPVETMVAKIEAAVAARTDPETFLIARTDALEPLGVDEALRRAEKCLEAGADGVYVEEPTTVEQLEKIGRTFRGVPQVANMLEGGGKTPWLSPRELHDLGFAMVLYPTTLLFRVARALQRGLADLKAGHPLPADDAVQFDEYERIVGLPDWAAIEERFSTAHPHGE